MSWCALQFEFSEVFFTNVYWMNVMRFIWIICIWNFISFGPIGRSLDNSKMKNLFHVNAKLLAHLVDKIFKCSQQNLWKKYLKVGKTFPLCPIAIQKRMRLDSLINSYFQKRSDSAIRLQIKCLINLFIYRYCLGIIFFRNYTNSKISIWTSNNEGKICFDNSPHSRSFGQINY